MTLPSTIYDNFFQQETESLLENFLVDCLLNN